MNFRNQRLGRHLAADYTIIMSRTLKVTGNHVMYDRGAWFLRVIVSSSRALSCLPLVKKQKHDFQVCFVYRAKNSWRQGLTNTKRLTKVAKELFADYVKEKKLTELEEKTESWHKLWKHFMSKWERIQNNQGLGKGYQPQPMTPTSTLIFLDITKTSSNN